jgi:hypothetical protein
MRYEFFRHGKLHKIEVDDEDFYFLKNRHLGLVQAAFSKKTGRYYFKYYCKNSRKQYSLARIVLRKAGKEFPQRIVHLDRNPDNFKKSSLGSKHDSRNRYV